MKTMYPQFVAIAGCVAVLSGGPALGQDWPQWRGPNRDAKLAGFAAPSAWPKELAQKWKVTVGAGDATPALAGERLYVFSRQEAEEVLRCLEAATGKELWLAKYEAPKVNGPDTGHGGPRSSPAIADGKVLTLGVCGTVSCFAAADGKVMWRKDDFPGSWPRFHTAMSPLVADGVCVVQLGKENEGAVVAYDLATGEQKWKWAAEGPGYASPVVMTLGGAKLVVTQTAKSVVALGLADGQLRWQTPFAPQGMAYNAATPIVEGQTVIFCGQGRGAKAVRLEQDGDTVTGKELWSNPENAVQFNSPILKQDLLFGQSQRGAFFCLDAKAGKTLWTDATGGRGGYGSIVDAGPVLMALNAKAQLTVFAPSNKEYSELASYKVAEKDTYAYPVISGHRIFIKDQDAVTLWTID